jgi:hypothetical protein
VHDEWLRRGRLHLPPDDTTRDDDIAFWQEVNRRLREAALAPKAPFDR